jgi:hypothetical protein
MEYILYIYDYSMWRRLEQMLLEKAHTHFKLQFINLYN